MKIIALDDDEFFLKELKEKIIELNMLCGNMFEITTYSSVLEFNYNMEKHHRADIYILDVELGNQTGMSMAENIRKEDEHAYIIFLTSHEKYAIQGYRYQAYSYIMKQRWKSDLPAVLNEIWKKYSIRDGSKYRIQSERRYDVIYVDDILYLEKDGKNVILHCKDGFQFSERATLTDALDKLPSEDFVLINRGQIVNIKFITHIDSESVEVNETEKLYISRNQLGHIREALFRYLKK